jgi:hypothetical protein
MIRHLWSQCRNINVIITNETIKYTIPVYQDITMLGKFRRIIVKDNTIIAEFDNIEQPANKDIPVAQPKNKNIDLE